MVSRRKLMITLIVILLVFTSLQSVIYTSVELDTGLIISNKHSALQLAANRTDFDTGDYLLRYDSGVYKLDLGSFAQGSTVSYPNAFALVNAKGTNIEITNISVECEEGFSPYVRVWLHKDSSIPCPNEKITGVKTEETSGDWGNLTNGDTALLYYNGTASGRWRWPASQSDAGFRLNASEEGYNHNKLNLNNGGNFGWNDSYDVWSGWDGVNNERGSAVFEGLQHGDPNWIWVQIDLLIPDDIDSITGTMKIQVQAV